MEIIVDRAYKCDTYSIGKMYIDDNVFCDTLEDADMGLTSSMSLEEIMKVKKAGITAIPTGRYKVTLAVQSPKFKNYKQYAFCKGYLPRLIDVPGYEGVLIHIGNYAKDTDGCILVGRNTVKGAVTGSTSTFKRLYSLLTEAVDRNESIYITIK